VPPLQVQNMIFSFHLKSIFICFQHNSVCGQSLAFFLPLSWGNNLRHLNGRRQLLRVHGAYLLILPPANSSPPCHLTDRQGSEIMYTLLFLSHRSRANTAQKTSNIGIRKQVCRAPADRIPEDKLAVRQKQTCRAPEDRSAERQNTGPRSAEERPTESMKTGLQRDSRLYV
jgi:hypothetical protein